MKRLQKTDYFNDTLENKAVVVKPGEGEALDMPGISCTFKVTSDLSNNQLGIYEIRLLPQTTGAKLHYHRFMDETFIVNKGMLTVELSDEKIDAAEGSVIYIPRFTPHGFSNNSDRETTLTLVFNPSQKREGFFHGLLEILNHPPIDPGKYLQLYNKYDSFPIDVKTMIP